MLGSIFVAHWAPRMKNTCGGNISAASGKSSGAPTAPVNVGSKENRGQIVTLNSARSDYSLASAQGTHTTGYSIRGITDPSQRHCHI